MNKHLITKKKINKDEIICKTVGNFCGVCGKHFYILIEMTICSIWSSDITAAIIWIFR